MLAQTHIRARTTTMYLNWLMVNRRFKLRLNRILQIVSAIFILSLLSTNLGFSLSANGQIHAPYSSNIPELDGQWSTSTEWLDASETRIENQQNMTAILRIMHNSEYIFVLLDFITDFTRSTYDLAGICFDTLDDGGDTPKTDDYLFGILAGQAPTFVYTYQGTGMDDGWGLTSLYGVWGRAGFSETNDPYEPGMSHRIYEWQVPCKVLGQASFYGFYAFVCDYHTETLLKCQMKQVETGRVAQVALSHLQEFLHRVKTGETLGTSLFRNFQR